MRRSPLIAAAVFVILLGATYLLLRGEETSEEAPFFSLKRRTPDTLVVIVPPDTTWIVPGGSTGWNIVAPVSDPADPVVVNALLKRINRIESPRTFPFTERKRDTYGMRFPRAVFLAVYADGTETDTLMVGAFTMDASLDYIRVGEQGDVGLFPAGETRRYLTKSTFSFRRQKLLDFHESRGSHIRILDEHGKVRTELHRDEDGSWNVVAPFPGPTDIEKIRAYLSSLAHMTVQSFEREGRGEWSPYGLDRPRASVVVRTTAGDSVSLATGNAIPGKDLVYGRTGDREHLLGVSPKYAAVLERDIGFLREPRLVPFGLQDADSLVVLSGNAGAHVWSRPAWASATDEARAVRGVLENWFELRAEGYGPGRVAAEVGLDHPEGSVFWLAGGDTLARVDVGTVRDGLRAVAVTAGRYRRPDLIFVPEGLYGPLWAYLRREASVPLNPTDPN